MNNPQGQIALRANNSAMIVKAGGPHSRSLADQALVLIENDRRRIAGWGWLLIALFVALAVFAASWVQIGGAIAVEGQVRAGGEPVTIRHETGGRLEAVLAQNGDRVQAGEALVLLDSQAANSLIADLEAQALNASSTIARLKALLAGDDGSVVSVSERALFEAERIRQVEMERLVNAQKTSLQAQMLQLESRIDAQRRELAVTRDELSGLRSLFERGLTAQARVRGLERLIEGLQAGIAASGSERAQLEGRLAEITQDFKSRQASQRADWLGQLKAVNETLERIQAEQQQASLLKERLRIKTPLSGIVIDTRVREPGTVIIGGEPLMAIVDDSAAARVHGLLPTNNIDQIELGQNVRVDLSPLDPINGTQINGTIAHVSADARFADGEGGGYPIEVMLDDETIVLPIGAPVQILIPTAQESLLARLLSPFTQRLGAALREG